MVISRVYQIQNLVQQYLKFYFSLNTGMTLTLSCPSDERVNLVTPQYYRKNLCQITRMASYG